VPDTPQEFCRVRRLIADLGPIGYRAGDGLTVFFKRAVPRKERMRQE
jgi:hypothetical protein